MPVLLGLDAPVKYTLPIAVAYRPGCWIKVAGLRSTIKTRFAMKGAHCRTFACCCSESLYAMRRDLIRVSVPDLLEVLFDIWLFHSSEIVQSNINPVGKNAVGPELVN